MRQNQDQGSLTTNTRDWSLYPFYLNFIIPINI